mgnify:CR=1 FL=1
MKIVLYNDLLNLKKTLIKLVFFILIFSGVQIMMVDNLGMGLGFPFLILSMTSLNVFYFSDVSRSDLYIMALGARKKDFVAARYLLSLLFVGVGFVISLILFALSSYKGLISSGEYFFGISLIFSFSLVWMGLSLPIYFKYDFSKARSMVVFIYLLIFFISFFLSSQLDMAGSVSKFVDSNVGPITMISIFIGIVFYYLSYIISKRMVKNKY